jgi:hypothetical protein
MVHLQNGRLERRNAAQSGRYRGADSLGDRRDVQTRVCVGLPGGRQRKLRAAVHAPSSFLVDIVPQIQVPHLACHAGGQIARIEPRNRRDTAQTSH